MPILRSSSSSSHTLQLSNGEGTQNQEKKKQKSKEGRKQGEPSASEVLSPQPSNRPMTEKRLARPSVAVLERIERAFEHRLYLIEEKSLVNDDPDLPSACKFFVLGTTGFVYTVRLDLRPSCTCPDFKFNRGKICKHILFVMLRVLKLPAGDPRAWKKALLTSELQELLLLSSVNDEAVMASHAVRARFNEIPGSSPRKQEGKKKVQRDLEGDCPVCYEPLDSGNDGVIFCSVCGNNVHRVCFMRWGKSKRAGTVTCFTAGLHGRMRVEEKGEG